MTFALPAAWVQVATKAVAVVPTSQPSAQSPQFDDGQHGTPYGLRARAQELARITTAWDDDAGDFNNQLNRSAFALGQLVAGGELDAHLTYQAIETLLAELGTPAAQYKTLRSGWTSGLTDPRGASSSPAERQQVVTVDGLRGDLETLQYAKSAGTDDEGEPEYEWRPWANFDVRTTGKIVDAEGTVAEYMVEVYRKRDGAVIETSVSTKVLANSTKLAAWLAGHEIAVVHHQMRGAWFTRLGSYLAGQDAPVARTARHLGWDDESESFLTYDGVLTPAGMSPFNGIRPDPILHRQAIQYTYGFEHDRATAVSVLREVLTFHDEMVTSVFGSWWAACWLKAQIMRRVSLFPIMAVRAPSESGKTNGFFPMMVALQGNKRGQANDTAANFRDIVAGHRSGIAWQDDLDDPSRLFELLRTATSEGTFGKKAEDRSSSVDARLVAPVMVSGENLSFDNQKALIDRVIPLEVGSPKGRRSLHDPARPQWDDIVAVRDRYPDLTVFAGHLGAMALACTDLVDQVTALRGVDSGRHADKLAILRLGARILARMTGDQHHIDRVDAWSLGQRDLGAENTLTLSLIPEYLKLIGAKDIPRRFDQAPYHSVPFPVLIRDDRAGVRAVWVNTDLLAQWWKEHRKGRVDDRTETASALAGQAREMGMKGIRAGERGVHWLRSRVHDGNSDAPNRNERYTWNRIPDGEAADRLLSAFDDNGSDDTEIASVTSLAVRAAHATRAVHHN